MIKKLTIDLPIHLTNTSFYVKKVLESIIPNSLLKEIHFDPITDSSIVRIAHITYHMEE